MTDKKPTSPRRRFLLQAATLAGAGSLAPLTTAQTASAAGAAAPPPYFSFSPDEASFIEAVVNILCPADQYSPNGVDCGLATYIDRQLAGPYGKGSGRYDRGPYRSGKPQLGLQVPLTPEQFCKAGIAAANSACVRDRGKPFLQLSSADANDFLIAIQQDRVLNDDLPLALGFNDILYKLFIEACFADPMYGGNRDAVFWKMIGYPGLPATHTLDMVRYRGKPYPAAQHPKSIADFS